MIFVHFATILPNSRNPNNCQMREKFSTFQLDETKEILLQSSSSCIISFAWGFLPRSFHPLSQRATKFKCHRTHGCNAIIFLLPLIFITQALKYRTNWTERMANNLQPKLNRTTFSDIFSCRTRWRRRWVRIGCRKKSKHLSFYRFGSKSHQSVARERRVFA